MNLTHGMLEITNCCGEYIVRESVQRQIMRIRLPKRLHYTVWLHTHDVFSR